MYLIGDIGNTEIKICLFNSNLKLIKKTKISTISLKKKIFFQKIKFLKKYKKKNL